MEYNCWNPNQIPEQDRKEMRGIIHIGAHYGQEVPDYLKYGMKNIVLIEPLKNNFDKLYELWGNKEGITLLNVAIGNTIGSVEMFVETANQGMSGSILEPGTHLQSYPQITFDTKERVAIFKLDNFVFPAEEYNALNIDVQGYELEVLRGAAKTLEHIDVIFTEMNIGEVYKGCGKLNELDDFLREYGFVRVHTIEYSAVGYGDAIYVKL
jgi:FkbM family methyltransferase